MLEKLCQQGKDRQPDYASWPVKRNITNEEIKQVQATCGPHDGFTWTWEDGTTDLIWYTFDG